MQYRMIGSTGLRVSPICLGTMTYGTPVGESDAVALTPPMVPSVHSGRIVKGKATRIARITQTRLELPPRYEDDSFFGVGTAVLEVAAAAEVELSGLAGTFGEEGWFAVCPSGVPGTGDWFRSGA